MFDRVVDLSDDALRLGCADDRVDVRSLAAERLLKFCFEADAAAARSRAALSAAARWALADDDDVEGRCGV